MQENFRNAGKFPALQKCRKISGTPEMPENFRHSRNAGKFQKCRKISGTPEMQENFRHSRSAGKFPALQKCRKISGTPEMQENFQTPEMPALQISGNFLHLAIVNVNNRVSQVISILNHAYSLTSSIFL